MPREEAAGQLSAILIAAIEGLVGLSGGAGAAALFAPVEQGAVVSREPATSEPSAAVGYDGSATFTAGSLSWTADVSLRGSFQPIDGRYRWYARVRPPDVDGVANGTEVCVSTPTGDAVGRLSDLDPWGRYRLSGEGTPPFAVDVIDEDGSPDTASVHA